MQKIDFNVWLDELKNKTDIISVASSYLTLTRKGKNYWACCPFHHEKTASFSINEMEQFYHCFGCKESGDVIKFVQKVENCDFMDAVKVLAEKCGMKIPNFDDGDDRDIHLKKEQKDKIFKILEIAEQHYYENIFKPVSKSAQDYIKFRGVTKKTLEEFKIGYSINWTEMVNYLSAQGFSFEDMKNAGIAEGTKEKPYDVYAERLIFPIYNTFGQCVGFSARILNKTDYAKYRNTTQTIAFDKSKSIFAIQIIKRLKNQGDLNNIIIVEGQMDVLSLFKGGFENAVACLGTALTADQARILKRFCDNVILCFDGDSAGIKATNRSIDILIENGLNVKVAVMPEKKDPDEIINQQGKEAMQDILDKAIPALDYKILSLTNGLDIKQNSDRAKFISSALEVVKKLATECEKQIYLELIQKLSGISVDLLKIDLDKLKDTKSKLEKQEKAEPENVTANKNIIHILASMIYKKEYAKLNYDLKNYIKNPVLLKLYNYIIEQQEEKKELKISNLFSVFDVENEPSINEIINYNFENKDSKKYFDDCLWILYDEELSEKQKLLSIEFSSMDTNSERKKEIMKQLNEILIQKKNKKVGK